jgi:archaellin
MMAGKKKVRARQKFGLAAAPIDGSFRKFLQYIHREVDSKEYGEVVKNYVKRNYSKEISKDILSVPSWEYSSSHMAGICYWDSLDNKFDSGYEHAIDWIKDKFETFQLKGWSINKSKQVETKTRVLTPVERAIIKIDDTIMKDLYNIEDRGHDGKSINKFDLYNKLKTYEIKRLVEVEQWIHSHLDDYKAVIAKEDDQVVEAYNHLKLKDLKARIALLEALEADLDNMRTSLKANRKIKISVKKKKGADKQVEKLKYQKENREYKLTSVNPMRIPGSMNVYAFNTKTRALMVFVSNNPDGVVVTGSTIKGFDQELSVVLKLRKPGDVLPVILKKTPKQIDKFIGTIKATKKTPSGRINHDVIILRTK